VYIALVWIHIVAAATWVGSMVFFAAAIVPTLRNETFRSVAPQLLAVVGRRFRMVGLVALSVLIASGVANLFARGLGWAALSSADFWKSGFGSTLAHKIGLVFLVVILTGAHDLLFGTSAQKKMASDPSGAEAQRSRKIASWLGRTLLLLSLAILYLAVKLVRGM